MFACSMYTTEPWFLDSVKTEVEQQVRRLQRHPSVVLWAGNNENEAALRGNWYKQGSHMIQVMLFEELTFLFCFYFYPILYYFCIGTERFPISISIAKTTLLSTSTQSVRLFGEKIHPVPSLYLVRPMARRPRKKVTSLEILIVNSTETVMLLPSSDFCFWWFYSLSPCHSKWHMYSPPLQLLFERLERFFLSKASNVNWIWFPISSFCSLLGCRNRPFQWQRLVLQRWSFVEPTTSPTRQFWNGTASFIQVISLTVKLKYLYKIVIRQVRRS